MNYYPNYNPNYYNPSYSYNIPYNQNMQPQQTQTQTLNGKIVDSKDIVKVTDVPIGSYGIFPKADLSEIYIKSWNNNGTTTPSTSYPTEMRDVREGKSPVMRKYYMESKEMHHGKEKQIEELERYLKELSEDITEMISGATTEEKTILKQKLAQLTNKIA